MLTYGNENIVVASFHDITDRRKVENEVTLLRSKLDWLLVNTNAVIYSCRPNGDFGATFISSNVKELIGYEADDFINDSVFWVNHIHPEDRQRVLENLSCLFDTDKHIHLYRFLHQNGDYRWMQDELRLIRNKDGQPVEIAGYWIDITELKKTQKALEEARLLSRAILDNSNNFIALIDSKGCLVDANQTALQEIPKTG